MTLRYGRAYGAERAVLSAPYQRGNRISIISAISIHKIEAAMYGQWSTDGEIFKHFIENDLLPILKPRHVVVMDNVKFHQSETIKELIHSVGARVVYLPPYHPELNPIEEMWSKIKHILRKLSARDLKTFKSSIKKAYEKVTQSDLLGWFKHAGY
jgi:transposase